MKRKMLTVIAGLFVFLVISIAAVFAQQTKDTKAKDATKKQQVTIDPSKMQHGYRFVDKNGDGYNDNTPDHDHDGIPNGVDPDYTGPKNRKAGRGTNFVDKNGDGINDNAGIGRGYRGRGRRGGFGQGKGNRTGICDGTGPKGNRTIQPNK